MANEGKSLKFTKRIVILPDKKFSVKTNLNYLELLF